MSAATGIDTRPYAAPLVDASRRADTSGGGPPLRVGLLVDSLTQPRWVRDMLASIQSSPFARIVLVVVLDPPARPATGLLRTWWQHGIRLAYTTYVRLDRLLFANEPDLSREVAIADLVSTCPVSRATSAPDAPGTLRDTDVAALRQHGLDVAILLGCANLDGDVLNSATYGVWAYTHQRGLGRGGAPLGFWEVLQNHRVTRTGLQVVAPPPRRDIAIYRSCGPTDRRSVTRNQACCLSKASRFVVRKLKHVHEEGHAALVPDGLFPGDVPDALPAAVPGNLRMVGLTARLAGAFIAGRLRNCVSVPQWGVAYRVGTAPTALAVRGLQDFSCLQPPSDRSWADPFPVTRGDRHYIFIEECPNRAGKGHIAVVELDRNGAVEGVRPVLTQDHHLSYPFVVEWQGHHYMIPEASQDRNVHLYRARDFPDRWELVDVLLPGIPAVDPTLVELDGVWWMFANVGVPGSSNWDELHLFCAPSLFGPWRPHRRNPVKSDVRSARPAGRIFRWRRDFYRPSQDCSTRYGHAIVINRILRLDAREYLEREVARISPTWLDRQLGTHTLNRARRITALDFLVAHPRGAWRRRASRLGPRPARTNPLEDSGSLLPP